MDINIYCKLSVVSVSSTAVLYFNMKIENAD
jgi:hypothetical protein